MTVILKEKFSRSGSLLAIAAAAMFLVGSASSANAWHNGHAHTVGNVLGGAAAGAVIGGIIKGGKGAAVGAGVGAALGAAASANSRPAPPPPRPAYQNNLVYNIQTSLTRLGYNPGPIDGVYGQMTADAISAYEYNNKLPVTGQPSPGLYDHMKSLGG
jgi:hypothetical protein